MNREITTYARPTLVAIGFFGSFLLPFWIPLTCVVLLSVIWGAWEGICVALFMDLVWLPGGTLVHTIPLVTLLSVALVWGFLPLRREFFLS